MAPTQAQGGGIGGCGEPDAAPSGVSDRAPLAQPRLQQIHLVPATTYFKGPFTALQGCAMTVCPVLFSLTVAALVPLGARIIFSVVNVTVDKK